MNLFATAREKLRALTDADNTDLPRWQRALLYSIDLGRFATHKLKQDRAPQMAAALTYHTLFSLIPTLVLTLVVAQAFISESQLNELKTDAVDWAVRWLDTGITHLEDVNDGDPSAGGESAAATSASGFSGLFRQVKQQTRQSVEAQRAQAEIEVAERRRQQYARTVQQLDDQLGTWLNELQNINFGSITLVGVLIFIYGSTKLLSTIETSFNIILRAEENRSWYIRLPLYYTTITLAPVVLLAGQWAQRQFFSMLQDGYLTTWIAGPLTFLSPLLTAWLVLLLAYRLLPNATIRLRPAAIGSFVAAVALGVAVQGFSFYVRSTGSTSLYGALALLPLFLLLLWIVWQIVLFGIEIASIIQFLPDRETRRARQREDDRPRLADPRLIIPALALFAARFRDGKPLEPETLAAELQLPAGTAEPMLAALAHAGYVHRLEGETNGYALARAPETIALPALLDTARKLGRPDIQAVTVPLSALDSAERASAEGQTLADLVDQ